MVKIKVDQHQKGNSKMALSQNVKFPIFTWWNSVSGHKPLQLACSAKSFVWTSLFTQTYIKMQNRLLKGVVEDVCGGDSF